MKFFRWILSHLTLIIVLSLILYIYWNRNDIWPQEAVEKTSSTVLNASVASDETIISDEGDTAANSSETQPEDDVQTDVQTAPVAAEPLTAAPVQPSSALPEAADYPQQAVAVPSADDFAERMRQYRLSLPVEDRAAMDKAEQVFQQVADGTIKFPNEADIGLKDSADKFPANVVDKKIAVVEPPDSVRRQSVKQQPEPVAAVDRAASIVSAQHTRELQKQIRNRQKQLQEQMVMLIPLSASAEKKSAEIKNSDMTKSASVQLKPVKPVINTPGQRLLLQQARQAFDSKNYTLAEKKYLQLSRQLPELPDVMGELANVYRTQNKISEYLQSSRQFVSRLVAHNRFNEAWKVVSATQKVDKKTAEQLRRLIKRKQKG